MKILKICFVHDVLLVFFLNYGPAALETDGYRRETTMKAKGIKIRKEEELRKKESFELLPRFL